MQEVQGNSVEKWGCGCGVLALVGAVLGFLPFLGWFNWLTTLPGALAAIFFGVVALMGPHTTRAVWSVLGGLVLLVYALVRLLLGGGVL